MRAQKIGNHELPVPTQHHIGDAGYDLRASVDGTVYEYKQILIPTGFAFEIPPGMVGFIKDRSGLATQGIHVLGGVVDSTYRGEIKVILTNFNERPFHFKTNDKIAQIVIIPCYHGVLELVDNLPETARGDNGFNSTGLQ